MAKADFEAARRQYPSTAMGDEEWRAFFDTAAGAHALGRILYDIYDKVVDEEEKEAGVRRMGRRPARPSVSLEQVYRKVLPPPPSLEPFPVALRNLMGDKSLRAFAPKVPMHVATLSRMMRGQAEPDLQMLERIAAAAKVHPSYFMEWRALYVGQLISSVFSDRPNLSISAYRALTKGSPTALREGKFAA